MSLYGVGMGFGNVDGLDIEYVCVIVMLVNVVVFVVIFEYLCFNCSGV